MDKLFELKGQLSSFYTKYSRYIDRVIRFVIALLTFTFISQKVGFSSMLASPLITVALSLICTFLPVVMIMLAAMLLVLANVYTVSLGMAIVSALIFLVMYALYLRYTPGKSVVVLCMLIAFMLKMPVLVPITLGLVGSPVCVIAVSIGTIFYYMIDYMNSYSSLIGTVAETGVLEQITAYAQQMFGNKLMWVTVVSYGLVLLIVYYLRRLEVDHAWKAAIASGALGNIIMMALSNVILDVKVDYVALILGNVAAVVIALVIEFFFFSVDYSRTEYLQFEDDEYYYYVKAVPKMKVAATEKTVKRINERQEEESKESKEEKDDDAEIQKLIDDELGR